jgi:hypothetical protein
MNFRSLIQKIETLEKKQVLTESTTQTTDNIIVENSSVQHQSSLGALATALLKEFGLEEAPAQNPWTGRDEAKAAAWDKLSPQDQQWLGGADPTDPYILRRAPNKGQPAAQSSTPQNATQAAQDVEIDKVSGEFDNMNQQAAMDKELDAATAQADANQANAVTGQPQAPQQSAQPAAKPAGNRSMTPTVTAYAASMGLLSNGKPNIEAIKKFQQDNGLTADGIIGPKTAGAIISAQKPGDAGSGRGGQGGPTAAQMATAPAPQQAAPQQAAPQQAAQPVNPEVAKIDNEIMRFSSNPRNNLSLPANQAYIQRLQAKRQALLNQPQQSAQPAARTGRGSGARGGQPAAVQTQSLHNEDDAILERIRNVKF